MAGQVGVDQYTVPGSTVSHLLARRCPATDRYGEVCQQYDPHTGTATWCPFMYGLRITTEGHHHGEARTPAEAARWMASAELYTPRTYLVLCLRQNSAGLTPGAIHTH